jgi:hypothetical protein
MTWFQYWSFVVLLSIVTELAVNLVRDNRFRACAICVSGTTLLPELWIGRRYRRLTRKRLADLLSPLKTSLSLLTVTVGLATVYGLRTHRTGEHRVAAPVFSLNSSKVDMILRLQW